MKIQTSAPGKLMLLGEHAVVYGYPCLVTAVDNRLYVSAELHKKNEDEIIAPQVKESNFVKETLKVFKSKYHILDNLKIETQSEFSHTVGFGSSSAVTVATLKALSILLDIPLSAKEIFDLSYEVVLAIQSVGSGFDVAIADYGHTLYFVGGGKEIRPLKNDEMHLVVGYSGTKADTPTLVKKVSALRKEKKEEIDRIFDSIGKLVEQATECIQIKKWEELGKLMTQNHTFLQSLDVSTDRLDSMVHTAVEAGAYGAKLSGAGGGDCMIALVNEDKREAVEKGIESAGGEVIRVKTNAEGVRVESS